MYLKGYKLKINEICFKNKKDKKFFASLIKNNKNINFFNENRTIKKLTECNLLSVRLHDKYRVLYLLKTNIVYIFFVGNRDKVYKEIDKRRLYCEEDYNN